MAGAALAGYWFRCVKYPAGSNAIVSSHFPLFAVFNDAYHGAWPGKTETGFFENIMLNNKIRLRSDLI
jgi:hypothetical protein